MSRLIVIRGPLGVGKSTVAQRLARELSGDYISIDNVLSQNNLDHIDQQQGCIPESNFLKVNQLIFPQVNKTLRDNRSVVIDGNFYHRPQIDNLINQFPQCQFFTLTAPLSVCVQRDQERPHSHGADAATAVYRLVSLISIGHIINTQNLSAEETLEVIKQKII